jgi:hypothetical protein
MTDERVAKLPPWARELIGEQERMIARLTADAAALQDRLGGVIRAEGEPDTVLVPAATVMADGSDLPDTPLGTGARIRFADFYEVHYSQATQALVVEADAGLAVIPGHQAMVTVRPA